MARALFVFTPAESGRLIGKAVAQLDEVQYALKQSNMLICHGPTNIFVLEELLGKEKLSEFMDPSAYALGMITQGILCLSAKARTTPQLIFKKGVITPAPERMSEALLDFDSDSVVIKGASAIDKEGNAAVLAANHEGGTSGQAIGTIVARGIHLIVPVGMGKLVPSVRQSVSLCGQLTFDYSQGLRMGMVPLSNAKVVTEIEAIKILTGVDAFHVASGGINGSEGSVVMVAEGEQGAMSKAIDLVESIKGEPARQIPRLSCKNCVDGPQILSRCQFRGKKEEELPLFMRNLL